MMFERLTRFERLTEKRALRPLTRLYTLLCVAVGFVLFRSESVGAGFSYLGAMFSFRGTPADLGAMLTPWTLVVLLCGVLLSAPLLPRIRTLAADRGRGRAWSAVEYVLCLPLYALCVMTLASSSFNPFIYYIF